MVYPHWMPCRRTLLQMTLGRRRRTMWLVFATLMILVFLYTHYSVIHIDDRYHRRLDRPSDPDRESKIVVFAVEYDDNDGFKNYDDVDDDDETDPAIPQRNGKPVVFPKQQEHIDSAQESLRNFRPETHRIQVTERPHFHTHVTSQPDIVTKPVESHHKDGHDFPVTKDSGNTVPMQIPAKDWTRIFTPTKRPLRDTKSKEGERTKEPSENEKTIDKKPETNSDQVNGFILVNQPIELPSVLKSQSSYALVQKSRRKLLRRECEEHNLLPRLRVYDTQNIVDKDRNFLYCPVEKAASTFMRRFMYCLTHSGGSQTIPSPFDTPIQTALQYQYDSLKTLFIMGIYNFVDVSTKFLVVREPYSRLFSAYLDKLYVPNLVYWKQWGIPAISYFRTPPSQIDSSNQTRWKQASSGFGSTKLPSAQALECGHDVTFPEFIKYVIRTLHETDAHLGTVRSLCAPCEMDYTLISHLETFSEDFHHLLKVLNTTLDNFSFETLNNDATIDSIIDTTYSVFEFFSELQTCISKLDMGKRLWKQMQLRGIISDELIFPLTEEEMDKMTPASFVRMLENARRMSRDTRKLHQQRQQALKDAFDAVSAEDILKLVEIYSLDFEMFGYDKYPDFIVQK